MVRGLARRPQAMTVKTTVPIPCTPPFPKIQQAKRPLTGAWFGGCQPMPAQSKLNDLRRDGAMEGRTDQSWI